MTKAFLLNASIKEFEDFENNAELYNYKQVLTKQGFSYVLVDLCSKEKISCAIHLNVEKSHENEVGRQVLREGFLSTRQQIGLEQLVKYKGFFIFISRYADYNQTMKQYGYDVIVLSADNLILTGELDKTYGFSSYDLVSFMPDWKILPYYYPIVDYSEGVVLLEIVESESLSIPKESNKHISQLRKDVVKFTLVNLDRKDSMRFVRDLQEYSLSSRNFGIVSTPSVQEIKRTESATGLMSLIISVDVELSYNITIFDETLTNKKIKTAIYKMEDTNNGITT